MWTRCTKFTLWDHETDIADSIPEEYTLKNAITSKRIDFVILEISKVIETKYVRESSHVSDLPDELKVDIESIHKHTDCSRMIDVVWDGEAHIWSS